jgi:hypothetical protein
MWRGTSFGSRRRSRRSPIPCGLVYLMTYGTAEEIEVVRRHLDLDDFRAALELAPPGIMDERSWAYWNVMTGRDPIPPMPQRVIP